MNVLENEPLSRHTNFRIGGPARWFVVARSEEELREAWEFARERGVPFVVIGGGSNTLARDEGFPGVVAQVAMRGVRIEGTTVVAEAGAMSAAVARQTADAGLEGFEWAISLPGTIGGAVRGNAGCFGGEMRDVVGEVRVMRVSGIKGADGSEGTKESDESKESEESEDVEVLSLVSFNFLNHELEFGYRESMLKRTGDIVLSVTLELRRGDRGELMRRLDETLAKRKASQPLSAGSAGCVFKNFDASGEDVRRIERACGELPAAMRENGRVSAGWIVDKLGLKGTRVGDAQISPDHGNFIVNLGRATASDVIQIISLVKTRARDEIGIELREEVQYL